jgi:hypothetical protein
VNAWQTAVTVTLVAGIFSVGATVLAARRANTHWLRQARLEAYTGLIAASESLTGRETARKIVRDLIRKGIREQEDVPPELRAAELARLSDDTAAYFDASDRMNAALAEVLLLGPRSVVAPAITLKDAASESHREQIGMDKDAFRRVGESYTKALGDFVSAGSLALIGRKARRHPPFPNAWSEERSD